MHGSCDPSEASTRSDLWPEYSEEEHLSFARLSMMSYEEQKLVVKDLDS
jgi:hypothetical protein